MRRTHWIVWGLAGLFSACGGFSSSESEPGPGGTTRGPGSSGGEALDLEVSAPAEAEAPAVGRGAPRTAESAAPASPAFASSSGGDVPRATTVTTTTTTTLVVDAEEEAPPSYELEQFAPTARLLTAAAVADADRRGNYLAFLGRHPFEARRLGLDMTRRVRIHVENEQGLPVHDARISVRGPRGPVGGRTRADGTWDFYPGVSAPDLTGPVAVRIEHGQSRVDAFVHVPQYGDGQDMVVRLSLAHAPPPPALDLAFLIDSTGSMGDELRYVNAEVAGIVARVRSEVPEVRVRVGAVFYRDRGDWAPLQQIPFTADVQGFAAAMQEIAAGGGGDYPEDMNAGLDAALHALGWSSGPAARVLVTIADAPPQRYPTQYDYRSAMTEASARGIRILPVSASGADREVEFLFRAMGAFTGTPYLYLTDDSGVGNPHLEADTDRVGVEYFSDLLTRLLIADLRGEGMHEAI